MNAADSKIAFALWLDTQTNWKVQYSIPLFHEIDFHVNEGYRRIPHGGVEVGGVLYGRIDPGSVIISAFRPIECDHASGPSFLLSESDLSKLASSIQSASQDEELKELVPIGWFIAHTRGPLQMTARELQVFEQFFPEPGRVTVLVKPERFKPTRFAFLMRGESGRMASDGSLSQVILPLSGRAGKVSDPVTDLASAPSPPRPERRSSSESGTAEREQSGAGVLPLQTPVEAAAPAPTRDEVSAIPEPVPTIPAPFPSANPARQAQPARPQRRSGVLVTVLLLAALLGSGAGYWAYLQLPPPLITLRVQKRQSDLLVVWNPIQTQAASYSAMRVNDGKPVLLSADQKASGIAEIPLTSGDTKVEIVSRQWARESRGIVRFLQATTARTR